MRWRSSSYRLAMMVFSLLIFSFLLFAPSLGSRPDWMLKVAMLISTSVFLSLISVGLWKWWASAVVGVLLAVRLP